MADPTTTQPTSFMDRQINTYGYPRPRRTTATQPQQATSTPWMPNGTPAPAPPQAAPAPQQPQYFSGGLTQGTAPQAGSVNTSGVYTPGQVPNQVYTPNQIQQFQAPAGQAGLNTQLQGMTQQLLSNPYSTSPQQLSQMKGANTDQAALLNRQSTEQLKSALASRGIDPNSGYGLGQQRALDAGMNQNILNTNRAMDLQTAQQNHADLLSALGLGDQFSNNQLQQAVTGYNANLQGAAANRDEQLAALGSQQTGFQQALAGNQLASQSQLAAVGNMLQGQQLANQNNQFGQTFGLDTEKFGYQKQLDAQQLALQQASQAASNSNFQDQLAFQYQQANQTNYNTMLSYLMGGGQ